MGPRNRLNALSKLRGAKKRQNDAMKFSYHFLLLDAQPDFSGTFHQDFSHIAKAR